MALLQSDYRTPALRFPSLISTSKHKWQSLGSNQVRFPSAYDLVAVPQFTWTTSQSLRTYQVSLPQRRFINQTLRRIAPEEIAIPPYLSDQFPPYLKERPKIHLPVLMEVAIPPYLSGQFPLGQPCELEVGFSLALQEVATLRTYQVSLPPVDPAYQGGVYQVSQSLRTYQVSFPDQSRRDRRGQGQEEVAIPPYLSGQFPPWRSFAERRCPMRKLGKVAIPPYLSGQLPRSHLSRRQ